MACPCVITHMVVVVGFGYDKYVTGFYFMAGEFRVSIALRRPYNPLMKHLISLVRKKPYKLTKWILFSSYKLKFCDVCTDTIIELQLDKESSFSVCSWGWHIEGLSKHGRYLMFPFTYLVLTMQRLVELKVDVFI